MLIASRTLKLRQPDGEVDVPVSLFAPARDETRGWGCRFEIGWPDETKSMVARGSDSVQALEIALRLIGTQLYTSVHHGAGTLVFEKPGGGYGFPLPGNLRDMLAGDDAAFFQAADRAALWSRVAAADFLTVNEKRAAVGYQPVEGGDELKAGGLAAAGLERR